MGAWDFSVKGEWITPIGSMVIVGISSLVDIIDLAANSSA
jgi:hypothetical protein